MKNLKITHFFHRPKSEVFQYFIRPELFENWAAPDGMTLTIPHMEAKKNGQYYMVHSNESGDYKCSGYFKEFIPEEKLVQIDTVQGPDGKELFRDLECITEFESEGDGTKVTITQSGFKDENFLEECRVSWEQCLAKLDTIFVDESFPEASL